MQIGVVVVTVTVAAAEFGLGFAERCALEEPEQVRRGEHRAESSNDHERTEGLDRQTVGGLIRREDRWELTPEAGESGQSE